MASSTPKLVDNHAIILDENKLKHPLQSLLRSNGILTIGNELEKQRFKNLVAKAKAKDVTTMIAVDGDWQAVAPLISDDEKRKLLVDSIVSLVLEFQLDGVDIFWKWPKTDADFSNLLSLIKDIREKFSETGRKLLISNLVSPSVEHSDFQKQISEIVDFLNIDINNHEGQPDLVVPGAPLYSGQKNQYRESVDRNLRLLSCWTKQPRKLNLVVCPDAIYWNNVINSEDKTSMKAELINGKVDGGLFYWKNIRAHGWNISEASWNHESMTPYIWNSNKRKYLTFDNEESVKHKIKYAEDKNVGGITFWELRSDDQEDTILQVVSSANLCSKSNDGLVKYNCDDIQLY
uniref:Glyco_18 domain-containing protein n=1 Tax=Caenorhabditis tropicalis TaxID=1561998 RepID=A0A1I7U9P7_9PELO